MFIHHRAVDLKFKKGTTLEVTFTTGEVKRFDMANMFDDYAPYKQLVNRKLFLSGKLTSYGIIWNEDIDVGVETIYDEGETVEINFPVANMIAADAVYDARCQFGISQKDLAKLTGISQADISRIERGRANPSVETLNRIAKALGAQLKITIE